MPVAWSPEPEPARCPELEQNPERAQYLELAQYLERAVRANLADSGVDEYWEIEVLLTLRRAADHRASAGDLGRECQVTSGAITNRISRLEKRGWIRRDVDPDDRRQVLVTLTEDGLARADSKAAPRCAHRRRAAAFRAPPRGRAG